MTVDVGSAGPTLAEVGADAAVVAEFACCAGDAGRVVRAERGHVTHLGPAGEQVAAVPRDLPFAPTVGDFGLVDDLGGGHLALTSVLPRRSLLGRGEADGTGTQQALAANVTHALITAPLGAAVHLGRLERMLALVWPSGATPVVVLTKSDLCPDLPAVLRQVAEVAPGVDVIALSATTGDGLPALCCYAAPGATLALLGASGAGKSTLANALAGAELLATGAVRGDGKGRHTTVRRELLLLPTGGTLIDTPGLRSVALWAGEDDGLEATFADVEAFAADCRFADCAHGSEPGCAVLGAIGAGVLAQRRLDSWRKLGRELDHQRRKQDARARAEYGRQWRAAHRPTREPRQ